jgi:hypothetical protein
VELGRIHLRHLARHPLAAEPLGNVEDRHGWTLAVARGAISPLLEDGVDRPVLAPPPFARRRVAAEPAARLGARTGLTAGKQRVGRRPAQSWQRDRPGCIWVTGGAG